MEIILYEFRIGYVKKSSIKSAIHGEKVSRLLQDKALRNDRLRKLILSLRAERSNLKGFQFHRELLLKKAVITTNSEFKLLIIKRNGDTHRR